MARQPQQLDVRQALAQASSLQRSGRTAQAEQVCEAILRARPSEPIALQLLGVCRLQRGAFAAAEQAFAASLRVQPFQVAALTNRGIALHAMKRYEEALACYSHALALEPRQPATLNMRGLALVELARFDEALSSFDRALQIAPDLAEAWCNRGNALTQLQRLEEALASLDRAEALRPDYGQALSNRSIVLNLMRRHDEALVAADRAVALLPASAVVHRNRADALSGLSRTGEALAAYERAVELDPNDVHIVTSRAILLTVLGRHEEARRDHDRTLALLVERERAIARQIGAADPAAAAPPHLRRLLAQTHYHRGQLLTDLARFAEAIESLDTATRWQPDHVEAHVSAALNRLRLGDFEHGWAGFEWRRRRADADRILRRFDRPDWHSDEDSNGLRVLLHAEQGFGDSIQFCRYAPLVAERGAHVCLIVQPELKSLLASLPGVEVIGNGEALPPFERHCPLMSLPFAFHTTLQTVPARIPYLKADPASVRQWHALLEERARESGRLPRIGAVWAGSPRHANDRARSVPLHAFRSLFGRAAQFINLNKQLVAADADTLESHSVWCPGDLLVDFAQTAALVENLDLVVTVDTSVAHLAGALGRPVWILLGVPTDFRWMLERDDSPWYPTARLFRQRARGDWDELIRRTGAALDDWLAARTDADPAR